MLIIFLLKSDLAYWLWALLISIVGFAFSNFYIYVQNKKTNDEHANIESIEIAEPKYIPIYIAYFVISLSINDIILFFIVYVIVFLFVIKWKFSYFNPYLLLGKRQLTKIAQIIDKIDYFQDNIKNYKQYAKDYDITFDINTKDQIDEFHALVFENFYKTPISDEKRMSNSHIKIKVK